MILINWYSQIQFFLDRNYYYHHWEKWIVKITMSHFWLNLKQWYILVLMFVDSLVPIYGFPIYQRWERPKCRALFHQSGLKRNVMPKGLQIKLDANADSRQHSASLYLSLFRSSNLLASIEVVGWPRFLKTCQLRGLSSGKVWVGYLFPRAFYPLFHSAVIQLPILGW